jgi:Tfp pilus assembly protein PilN
MRAVNLLPSDRKREADARGGGVGGGGGSSGPLTTKRVAIVGGVLAAIVCGFVAFSFVGARSDVARKQDALDAIQQQVAEAQAQAIAAQQSQQTQQPQTATTALPADLKAQLDAFNMVASARIQWDQLLSDVSRVIPEGSWLSSLTLQGAPATPVDPSAPAPAPSTPTTAVAPTGFVVSGFALSQPVVAKLLQQLALVPMLSDVTLQRSERANVGADQAFQFTLSANVRLDGAS